MKKHASATTDETGIQRYALDSTGNVVNVRDIQDKNDIFSCPACHDIMIPRRGKIRTWHFAHKTNTCSYESYLHALAKIRIAEWFENNEIIILDMEVPDTCESYSTCKIRKTPECIRKSRIQYNLKEFYKNCDIERRHNGFIADILCQHPKSPLFIEIFVSHECSENKKSSGQRIIEFIIDSEDAINKIISSQVIYESENTRLYNFKRNTKFHEGKMTRCLAKRLGTCEEPEQEEQYESPLFGGRSIMRTIYNSVLEATRKYHN